MIKKSKIELWNTAVNRYVKANNINTVSTDGNWIRESIVEFELEKIRTDYNIDIRGFIHSEGEKACTTIANSRRFDKSISDYIDVYRVGVSTNNHFVVTDTKVGAAERAKYHWRNTKQTDYTESVYVIEQVDKNKPMLVKKFFKDMYNPPRVHQASQLLEKERENSNWGKASILRLEERKRSRHTNTMAWANAGTAGDYDQSKTYYYVELKGWDAIGLPVSNIKDYHHYLYRSGIFTDNIYGVRKNDIEAIKTQKNWVELTSHVREKLKTVDMSNVMGLVKQAVDINSVFKHNVVSKVTQDSPYVKLYNVFKDAGDFDSVKQQNLEILFKCYGIVTNSKVDPNALIAKYKVEVENIKKRYPLLNNLSYYVDKDAVVEYINLIDQAKGN